MKKILLGVFIAIIAAQTVCAAEIPAETYPEGVSAESAVIVENLIGDILDEVQNGLGYADAYGRANRVIYEAVLNKQTNGVGYAELAAIARNAVFAYRDMYLRPDYYAQAEEKVKAIIADLISEVENGVTDYPTARKQAYIQILQAQDPSFRAEALTGDFCYWDLPTLDSVMFNRARKLLKNAELKAAESR